MRGPDILLSRMSKLSDAIRKTTRPHASPIGFQPAAARKPAATLLLVATLRNGSAADAQRITKAGADSLLLAPDEAPDKGLDATVKGLGETAVGLWLRHAGTAAARDARAAGVDYLVFSDEGTPAEVLIDEKLGFVLSLAEGADDTMLRSVGTLSLDAMLVSYWEGELTVRRALELRRLAALSQKPLMLSVSTDVGAGELEALRDSGVAAVIVDGERTSEVEFNRLRAAIDALPPRRKRREERQDASIPSPSAAGHDHHDDDDD